MKGTMMLCITILILNLFFRDGEGSAFPCQYLYTNLPHSLTLEANAEVEQPIYNITIGYTAGGSAPKTVDLRNPSDYFAIENNVVMVNSCLPASGPSNAIIHLEIEIDGEEINCPSAYLSVTVEFTVPDFNIPSGVVVDVDLCTTAVELEVHQIQFNNDDYCNITFTCFVNNTNGQKLFKIGSGNSVTAATDDIIFNLTYKLNISCYDSRASLSTVDPNSKQLDVTFHNVNSCTLTESSTTTIRSTSLTTLASTIMSSTKTSTLMPTRSSLTSKLSPPMTTVTSSTEIHGSPTTVLRSPVTSVDNRFTAFTEVWKATITSLATVSPTLFVSLSNASSHLTTIPTPPEIAVDGLALPAILAISTVGGVAGVAAIGTIGACIYKSVAGNANNAAILGNP